LLVPFNDVGQQEPGEEVVQISEDCPVPDGGLMAIRVELNAPAARMSAANRERRKTVLRRRYTVPSSGARR
jgi:histidyl-tRNA synthetase